MPAGGHPSVALQVFRISHLLGNALDEALAPVGLDGDDFAVLSVLGILEPIAPSELAETLSMSPSSFSARMARLERRRLLRRRREKAEGRVLELTPLGERKLGACRPIFQEFIGTVEKRLGRRLRPVQDALADLGRVLEEPATSSIRSAARTSS